MKIPPLFYVYTDKKTTLDTSTHTFVGSAVKAGHIAILDVASVYDLTTEDKKFAIGKRSAGGVDHYIKVGKASEAFGIELNGKMILNELEKPFAICYTPDADDVMYCTFTGEVHKKL